MEKKKLTKAQIRKLKRIALSNVHHWQMIGRIDLRCYRASADNVRHYASELRKLQQLENKA